MCWARTIQPGGLFASLQLARAQLITRSELLPVHACGQQVVPHDRLRAALRATAPLRVRAQGGVFSLFRVGAALGPQPQPHGEH